MADYQSILTINVQHEYYNSHNDELAPFNIIPDQKTASLLTQYSMLMKSSLGFMQLIVDSELFSDLAGLTQEFNLKLYLVSTDPVVRSITEMPNMFDISTINAEFTQSKTLNITVDNWISGNQSEDETEHNGIALYNKNLIGILNVRISRNFFTLEEKNITLRFNAISTHWKYYFFSLNLTKDLNISGSSTEASSFTEQEHEQIAGKTARIFLSNNRIPLRKVYTEFFSLLNDRRTIVKSLPSPSPDNISTVLIDDTMQSTAYIYVS